MNATFDRTQPMYLSTSNFARHLSQEGLYVFAKLLRSFQECDEEIQNVISSMARLATDSEASDEDVEGALETLREGLFPSEPIDLEADHDLSTEELIASKNMNEEEETFATRLGQLMKFKGVTQSELAIKVGVGQPSISMMLSRSCRPQRKTLEKLAHALDVAVEDLWPKSSSSRPLLVDGSATNAKLESASSLLSGYRISATQPIRNAIKMNTRIRSDALGDLSIPSNDPHRPVAA